MGSSRNTQSAEKLLCDALSMGDIDQIFQILDNNDHIDVNLPDPSHELQTPLMSLCHIETNETDRMAILEAMLEKCPDINVQDGCGRTLLCHACISQRHDFVRVISRFGGCDPSLTDCDGNTALLLAIRSNDLSLVQLMLESFDHECLGLDAQNHRGVRPLDEAQRVGRAEFTGLLQRALQSLAASPQLTPRTSRRQHHTPSKHTPFAIVNPHRHSAPGSEKSTAPTYPAEEDDEAPVSANSSVYRCRHRGRRYKAAANPQISLDASYVDAERTPRVHHAAQLYTGNSLETTQTVSLEDDISDQDYDASDEGDEEESGEDVDEGYEEKPVKHHRRKNSISLPDLRGSSNLISGSHPISPNSYSTFISDDFTSSCQNTGSSFDKPSQRGFTSTYDELSIPQMSDQDGDNLDEFDSENMPTFRESQEKKDSVSLPDLRGCGSLVTARTEALRRAKEGRKRDKSLGRRVSPHHASNDDDDVYGSAGHTRMSQSHGASQLTLPSLDVTNKTTNGSLPNLKVKSKKSRYYDDPANMPLAQVAGSHEVATGKVVRKGHRKFKAAQQS